MMLFSWNTTPVSYDLTWEWETGVQNSSWPSLDFKWVSLL